MRVSIKAVENGVIVTSNGKDFVFADSYELGTFILNAAKDEKKGVSPNLQDLIISHVPPDKLITAIKIVREITGLGLREAKDLVDGIKVSGGAMVLDGVDRIVAANGLGKINDLNAGITARTQRHVM